MSLVSFPITPEGVANVFTAYQDFMRNRREERIKLTDATLYKRDYRNNMLWSLGLNSRVIEVRITPVIAAEGVEVNGQEFDEAMDITDMYNNLDLNSMMRQIENIRQLLSQLLWFAIEQDDCSHMTVKHVTDVAHILLNRDVALFEFCSLENKKRKWNVVIVLPNDYNFPNNGELTRRIHDSLLDA
mmetsp:Transcript_23803/g.34901  ORF Transcript_23803/g.34901 Transcript_23803/m.34901 type:complete len:186 (-) Transcript_23803:221-778(-)|eukprot:CAMPEP_0185025322 /NCGR_PEP_ID=MMETSP1103-20130426/8327_1 /TAXON_ID=36769 /ORGANISM="Paraphysomonas bandaiensis, Strain Caron Lab Isolate" /LENGTH=185 /DNA_ID=CAMNT_0027558501 /DNA_START=57 /DNA_END=614 /DNA_ORIENTATION=+